MIHPCDDQMGDELIEMVRLASRTYKQLTAARKYFSCLVAYKKAARTIFILDIFAPQMNSWIYLTYPSGWSPKNAFGSKMQHFRGGCANLQSITEIRFSSLYC